jgi:hypothetical protein
MAWEQRRGGPVYYRSLRVNGRPTKVYLGKGEAAEAQARQVEQRRLERQQASEAWQSEQAEVAVAQQRLSELRALADLLVRVTFLGAGFHEHRGQYRRRRHARGGDQGQGCSQA